MVFNSSKFYTKLRRLDLPFSLLNQLTLMITIILFVLNSLLIPAVAFAGANKAPETSQSPFVEFASTTTAATTPLNQRHPFAGAYPVWSYFITPEELEGKYSFLNGQQLFVKWNDLKPDENSPYQWQILDDKVEERLGNSKDKVLYLQVNAGWPDWIYDHVAKGNFTKRGENPPQFWDPVYIEIYTSFINDLAQHIAQSDYKNKIILVRAQYNAFSPESITPWGHQDYTDYSATSSGHRYEVDFTRDIGNDYAREIVDAYLNAFDPLGIMVVSKPFGSTRNDVHLAEEFANKGVGLFLTNSTPNPVGRNEMLQFAKEEAKTRAFSEPRNASKSYDNSLQWIYWQTLADLHQGVEFISYYGEDIITDKYTEILKFADKYAGWYREPSRSPGGWIAFRGVETLSGSVSGGGYLDGNFEYLIAQIDPDSSIDLYAYEYNQENVDLNLNPQSKPTTYLGTKSQKEGIWARETNGRPIYLDINDTFASSLTEPISVRISYFDNSNGRFELTLRDRQGQISTRLINKSNSMQWKDITIPVDSYQFSNGLDRNADIVLAPVDDDDIFHMVEIIRDELLGGEIPPPPTITPTPTLPQPTNTPTPAPTGTAQPPVTSTILAVDSPTTVTPGETFDVGVTMQDVPEPGLFGVQLTLNYDPNMVSVENLVVNPDLSLVLRESLDEASGQIILVASREGQVPGLTGNVPLFTFEATAAGATGEITFTFDNEKISNPQAQSIDVTSQDGTVTIDNITNPIPDPTDQPATPTPTSEPSPQPTAQPTSTPQPEPTPTPTSEPIPSPTVAPPSTTTIVGQVVLAGRTGNNWANAILSLEESGQSTTTDASGDFSLANVTVETPTSLTADAPGYLPAACTISTLDSPETSLTPVTLVSGDINNDLQIDISDATAVGANFGQTGLDLVADINLDNIIDIFDIVLVAANFGQSGPQIWSCQ